MKKFRIKEEAKKYFNETEAVLNQSATLSHWNDILNVSLEALEEVEEKIEIGFKPNDWYLHKNNTLTWTEQERKDIEKFLNVFGSWEMMSDIANEYYEYAKYDDGLLVFKNWLKEKGYDKD